MFLTALLVFTILMLAVEKHHATFIAPIGIGLALFVGHLAGARFTGGKFTGSCRRLPFLFRPSLTRRFYSRHQPSPCVCSCCRQWPFPALPLDLLDWTHPRRDPGGHCVQVRVPCLSHSSCGSNSTFFQNHQGARVRNIWRRGPRCWSASREHSAGSRRRSSGAGESETDSLSWQVW